MAAESEVLPLTDDVLPEGMKIIELPGHSPEMTGFLTPTRQLISRTVFHRRKLLPNTASVISGILRWLFRHLKMWKKNTRSRVASPTLRRRKT